MIKKIILFNIVVALLFFAFFPFKLSAQDQDKSCGLSLFMKWYEWKISTDIPERQRTIVNYLRKIDNIRNKAFDTIFVNTRSLYGDPDIKRAVKISKDSIVEIEEISPPKECVKYKKRIREEVQYVLEYHELRLKYGDGTKEFDKKHHVLELDYSKKNIESDMFSEFYICVKKSGLMGNIEKEIKKLSK